MTLDTTPRAAARPVHKKTLVADGFTPYFIRRLPERLKLFFVFFPETSQDLIFFHFRFSGIKGSAEYESFPARLQTGLDR